ncbi:MAG: sensor histidine kinase [Bacteroidia bacterium]
MSLSIFLSFFSIFSLASAAQTPNLNPKLQQIDDLVYFNKIDKATQKIDSITRWLNSQSQHPDYQKTELQLNYYKAYIKALNYNNSLALQIALNCARLAKEYKQPEWEFKAHLLAASLYEQSKDLYTKCAQTLDESYMVYKMYKLDHLYSTYCIRKSSYYRFVGKIDSAIFFATEGLDFAKKYNYKRDQIDAHLLLGILYQKTDHKKSIRYASIASHELLKINHTRRAAAQYLNISGTLFNAQQFDQAIVYADSAYSFLHEFKDKSLPPLKYFDLKQQIYFAKGQLDSAYFYLKELNNGNLANRAALDKVEINRIAEKYENEKKEEVIKSKNKQFNLIACLLIVTASATLLVLRKNRKIKAQNKIINNQLDELNEVLEVKKTLLSELQHRVKNNLQNIMSILEIQKESVDFNNIDELIRANQNRVQSMVLLHQRLEVSQDMNQIKAENYITDLATLVRNSYVNRDKKVKLEIRCTVEELAITQAQPLGMIIVELISNSCKHAFKNQKNGTIRINMSYDLNHAKTNLYYMDNGIGFDPTVQYHGKGLGLEIIYGLTNQLNGKVKDGLLSNTGFSFSISF